MTLCTYTSADMPRPNDTNAVLTESAWPRNPEPPGITIRLMLNSEVRLVNQPRQEWANPPYLSGNMGYLGMFPDENALWTHSCRGINDASGADQMPRFQTPHVAMVHSPRGRASPVLLSGRPPQMHAVFDRVGTILLSSSWRRMPTSALCTDQRPGRYVPPCAAISRPCQNWP